MLNENFLNRRAVEQQIGVTEKIAAKNHVSILCVTFLELETKPNNPGGKNITRISTGF